MPEYNYSLIRKLANTALRLNKVLVCAIFFNLLTLTACCWALTRVVKEERYRVSLHFERLMGGIRQHEDFLSRVAQHGNTTASTQKRDGTVPAHRLLVDEQGRRVYEGAEYPFSMPFTLAQQHIKHEPHPGNFSLGVLLATFYGYFWSTSDYPSPQVFIMGPQGNSSVAVPAIGHFPTVTLSSYFGVVQNIYNAMPSGPWPADDVGVRWAPARHYSGGESRELLGYRYFTMTDALWWAPALKRQIIAASLLDLGQVLQNPAYDRLQLISPQGESLVDDIGSPDNYQPGLNIAAHGLVFKVGGISANGWVALYEVTYQSFFGYAKWQVPGGLILLVASLLGSWAATQWYARKVIAPARRAHLEIVESDTFSRTVIQTAPVALCVLRREDRQLLMHNPLAEKLLGNSSDIERLSEGWDIGTDTASPASDVVFETRSAATLHGSFAAARYRGQDVVLCAFNDISAHRQAEQKLAEAKRNADAASAAKSRFLATMSHEIRTPLYGALGTLELLGLTDLNQQQRSYQQTIERSSLILMQLVSDVLDVSKIEAGEMTLAYTEFSPAELAEDVVGQFAGVAQGKSLSLQLCIDPAVPGAVKGDAFRIRQILTNLLSNALKFTEQGSVTLMVGAQLDGAYATLEWQVIDTGIGIAASDQTHLFEPFYQAHPVERSVSGTGLGLSICVHLAQLMGGRLEVASEVGVGSRFTFGLTLELRQRGATPRMPRPSQETPVKLGLSILVAEDNPINQALISNQLEELGCRVTLASNGLEALQLWVPGFDALLTDVNMPVMDGYQLVRTLRRQGATQPIVAISASAMQEEIKRFVGAGVTAWLVKPISLRDLYEVLRDCRPGAGAVEIVPSGKSRHAPPDEDIIKLSPRMRELFLTTLHADIQALQEAGQRRDVTAVAQQLHRLHGALAAVNARHLGQACEQLGQQLLTLGDAQEWTVALAALVKDLERMLVRLPDASEHKTHAGDDNPRSRTDTGSDDEE